MDLLVVVLDSSSGRMQNCEEEEEATADEDVSGGPIAELPQAKEDTIDISCSDYELCPLAF